MQRFGKMKKQQEEKVASDHTSRGTEDQRPTSVFIFNFLLKIEEIRYLDKLARHRGFWQNAYISI
jgi:hypothetical protein